MSIDKVIKDIHNKNKSHAHKDKSPEPEPSLKPGDFVVTTDKMNNRGKVSAIIGSRALVVRGGTERWYSIESLKKFNG